MNNTSRNALIVLVLVVLDQILKAIVQYGQISVNLGIVFIHEIRNTGASFGILQNNNTFLMLVSFAAIGAIILNLKKISQNYYMPVSILSAGILGNLIDRIFRGYVVDFFDLGWWPAFNLADSCIFIGVFWIAKELITEDLNENKKTSLHKSNNRK